MDPIKEAFSKIKEDITQLKQEIRQIKELLSNQTTPTYNHLQEAHSTDKQTNKQTHKDSNLPVQSLYPLNIDSSIGNGGVPTDKQTNRQTDRQAQNTLFSEASSILDSLDSIKKGIRLKFRRLTSQEMLVFSTLYGLEEQNREEITYKMLSEILNLSESSIRDYINKLTKKGVPIEKIRQNNKIIILKVSEDLKKVATLDTIINLRSI